MSEKNEQLKSQYKAVAHLARSMANLCDEMSTIADLDNFQNIVDIQGERTHYWMDQLGTMLDSCDAVSEDDEWIAPLYDEARRIFPLTKE